MTLPYRPTAPELCPTCGKLAKCRCRCPLGDSRCPDGHEWHQCPKCGATVAGAADHAGETFGNPANLCPICRETANAR